MSLHSLWVLKQVKRARNRIITLRFTFRVTLRVTRSVLPVSKEEKEEKRRKHMSIINKPPQHVKREYELEEPVALVVEKYATFIDSTPDHVVNSALKMLLWKDKHFMNWRKQQQQAARKEVPITGTQKTQARA